MAIMTLANLRDRSAPPIDHDGHCDCCGKRLTRQFVFWYLGRVSLALHCKCAEEFGATLIYEGRRAQDLAEGRSPTSGIHADLLKNLQNGGRERPVVRNKNEWELIIAPGARR